MLEDRPALPEIRDAQRERADIERKEAPTDIGPPRASCDERAERDHPAGERDILAPLPRRNPRAGEKQNREHDAEGGGIEQMLSARTDQRLRKNRRGCGGGMDPQIIRAQQQREAQSGDDRAAIRSWRIGAQREERCCVVSAAAKVRIICAVDEAEIAQARAGREQDSEEQNLEKPRIGRTPEACRSREILCAHRS